MATRNGIFFRCEICNQELHTALQNLYTDEYRKQSIQTCALLIVFWYFLLKFTILFFVTYSSIAPPPNTPMEPTPSHSDDTPAAKAQVAEPVSMKDHAIPSHIETVVTPSSSPNLVQVSEQSVTVAIQLEKTGSFSFFIFKVMPIGI